jgi:choice-of-anchor B domain-containing protein
MARLSRRFELALVLGLCISAAGVLASVAGAVPAADRVARLEPAASIAPSAATVAAAVPTTAPATSTSLTGTPCVGGLAGDYPCESVDLLAHLPLATFSSPAPDNGNDCWGWTDPLTGIEYAIATYSNGTAFVDISDPLNPVHVGFLPTHNTETLWRDVKTYADHAFIVSEASGHGMQVFDLTQLRTVTNPPVTFAETAHYDGVGNVHNIVINESTGFAYAVGANQCSGGLHMIDIRDPQNPTFAGCFSADGYTHDAQCVSYHGPDTEHRGSEICFACNEDTITIVDVTDKQNPVQLSRFTYPDVAYVHQGWLTDDHVYFIQDDELDEWSFSVGTTTYSWDVTDLDNPVLAGAREAATPAIDHNQYTRGQLIYQANYTAGMRILDLDGVATGTLVESAYFDTHPAGDQVDFDGAWSVYPYFASGVVIINTMDEGLFIVRPSINQSPLCDAGGSYDGAAGAAVQFDASGSTDPEGPITSYAWDFGDGNTGDGPTPMHGYADEGDYVVVVCVTDASGDESCCGTTASIQAATAVGEVASPAPRQATLHQNQPNPFNPTTRIAFELAEPGHVALRIVDAGGRSVRTLLAGEMHAGSYAVEWDGRDHSGRPVHSGVYLYRLEVDSRVVSRKMVLAK